MNTSQLTCQEISDRDFLVYLKGRIVGYAVKKGMKWASKNEMSEAFKIGYDESVNKLKYFDRWTGREDITAIHVMHNRLRHTKPHTDSVETDNVHLARMSFVEMRSIERVRSDFAEKSSKDEVEVKS